MNQLPQEKFASPREQAPRLDEQVADAMPLNPVPSHPWQEADYRAVDYVKAGLVVGSLAGCTSLLLNVVGSLVAPVLSGQDLHPLRLIQVYLTFPFGASALQWNAGITLALGCLLYLTTGMLYGMLFEWMLSYFVVNAGLGFRLAICSIFGLLLWLVNFYAILLWLQPALFDGRWIVDLVPWWVAAFTHLAFSWTIALLYPFAKAIQHR